MHNTCRHKYIHTDKHTHIHTCIQTHTHTHAYIRTSPGDPWAWLQDSSWGRSEWGAWGRWCTWTRPLTGACGGTLRIRCLLWCVDNVIERWVSVSVYVYGLGLGMDGGVGERERLGVWNETLSVRLHHSPIEKPPSKVHICTNLQQARRSGGLAALKSSKQTGQCTAILNSK